MARISIYEDGTAACWVSDDIQTDVEKTWLKAVLSDGVYGIHSIIHQDDDGTSSIAIKHFDDLEDKEYDDD